MKKIEYGQFFTKKTTWLTQPVSDFIYRNTIDKNYILDPFAGNGDLFKIFGVQYTPIGYDIDETLNWEINDSLINIPVENTIRTFIITNPPYLAKNSCNRKGLMDTYNKYFLTTKYDDLYLIALEKLIQTGIPGIAIVPETVINSRFPKEHINRIVIIEANPFEDTEIPVCVVCFNGSDEPLGCEIYKNDTFIDNYSNLQTFNPSLNFHELTDLKFNDPTGQVALIAIDSTNPNNQIKFLNKHELKYDLAKVGFSSRAITVISSQSFNQLSPQEINLMVVYANQILNEFRIKTADVLLSPFKNNNKLGSRRRRLDFKTARNIIEIAYLRLLHLKGEY